MEKVLNQDEIDAMVLAARGGGTGGAAVRAPNVKKWDVHQVGQIGRDQMRAISVLHEAFARNLTHALGAFLRVVMQVGLVSAEHLTYREFLQRLPELTYMCSCNLTPLNVMALMQLDLSVVFPLIDLLLGGEGRGAIQAREITDIEEQILESVVQITLRELGAAWQALNLEFRFDKRQAAGNAQRLMLADEKTLSLSFEVTMPDTRGTINLAVPAVVSNALLRKLTADSTYRRPKGPPQFREQVRARLMGCLFDVQLEVNHLRVPVEQLASLRPGTVLAFHRKVESGSVLSVGNLPIFSASVARRGNQRVAKLAERQLETNVTGSTS
jgi:flagellar motor switch protein FliM